MVYMYIYICIYIYIFISHIVYDREYMVYKSLYKFGFMSYKRGFGVRVKRLWGRSYGSLRAAPSKNCMAVAMNRGPCFRCPFKSLTIWGLSLGPLVLETPIYHLVAIQYGPYMIPIQTLIWGLYRDMTSNCFALLQQ